MQCQEIMKTPVECCGMNDSVEDVADRMRELNIGFVPVCDEPGAIVGTLTDRNLAIRVLGEHLPAETLKASDVMTREVVCCSPTDDLGLAEELMRRHKKSRIVCVDERRRPVGIISLSDLMEDGIVGVDGPATLKAISTREARINGR